MSQEDTRLALINEIRNELEEIKKKITIIKLSLDKPKE